MVSELARLQAGYWRPCIGLPIPQWVRDRASERQTERNKARAKRRRAPSDAAMARWEAKQLPTFKKRAGYRLVDIFLMHARPGEWFALKAMLRRAFGDRHCERSIILQCWKYGFLDKVANPLWDPPRKGRFIVHPPKYYYTMNAAGLARRGEAERALVARIIG